MIGETGGPESMRWDGTRAGIEAICRWANAGLSLGEDPFVTYNFTGPDDVNGVVVWADGDFRGMAAGDTLTRAGTGFTLT